MYDQKNPMFEATSGTKSNRYTRYLIEFIVIVFGITASFWVEEYREGLQNNAAEKKVLQSLLMELDEIELYCNNRITSYSSDLEIIQMLLDDTAETDLDFEQSVGSIFPIQVAIYDYRGFQPPMVRYQSILNEGSFKYVSSDAIKTKFNELNTASLALIEGNVAQEKDIQYTISLHLSKRYPDLITDFDGDKEYNPDYIEKIENILAQDDELRALLKLKFRFAAVKLYFVGEYAKIARELNVLIHEDLNITPVDS